MKTKIISIMMTEEEYMRIKKATLKDAINNGKKPSTSAFLLDIILSYLDKKEQESQVSNQDNEQVSKLDNKQDNEQVSKLAAEGIRDANQEGEQGDSWANILEY